MTTQDSLNPYGVLSRNATRVWSFETSPNQTRGHFETDRDRRETLVLGSVEPARTVDVSHAAALLLRARTITATFEDGVLKPAQTLNLPAHAEVRITIELLPASSLTVGQLNAFLRNLPALDDDAEVFAQDVRAIHAEPPLLRVDEGGVVRVGKSRISLDLVVEQYENGMTAEEMVRAYDTLVLADIHATIAYYLRHRDKVRSYLKQRAVEAQTLRSKIEAERPLVSREELLARRSAREKDNAPTGQ